MDVEGRRTSSQRSCRTVAGRKNLEPQPPKQSEGVAPICRVNGTLMLGASETPAPVFSVDAEGERRRGGKGRKGSV